MGAGVTSSHGIVLGPKYIRTKLSVLVAKIIQMDYPESWNAAFEDIATMLEKGNTCIDLYLRILIALDQEIFESNTQYWTGKTRQELTKNTTVKDTLRKSKSMQNIVSVWYQILSMFASDGGNAEAYNLVSLCLESIKCWARWVELNYLVDQRFLQFFYNAMESSPTYRDDVCDCLHEILARGMPPGQKINLIEGMNVIKLLNSRIGIHYGDSPNSNGESTEESVTKFSIVGRLVDTCCFELLQARDKMCEFLVHVNTPENNTSQPYIHGNGEDVNDVMRDLKRCEFLLMELLHLYWAYLRHPRFEVSSPLIEESLRLFLKIMQKEKKCIIRSYDRSIFNI